MITLTEIRKDIIDGTEVKSVLKDINLTVHAGEFVTIMGASGAGKTTLFKILSLLESFDSGQYFYKGIKINFNQDIRNAKIRKNDFAYIPQQMDLIDNISAYENIMFPLYIQKKSISPNTTDELKELAQYLGIDSLLEKNPARFSLGEKQRLAIARACIKQPYILFADEPTSSLDRDNCTKVINLLQKMNQNGTTIIMITHDERNTQYATSTYYLENGNISKT